MLYNLLVCLFVCFFSENTFNKGPNLLHLNSTDRQCLVTLHLDTNMKTPRPLWLDLTALDYFLSPPLPFQNHWCISNRKNAKCASCLGTVAQHLVMLHYYVDSLTQGERMKKSQKHCSGSGNHKSNSPFLLAVGKEILQRQASRSYNNQLVWLEGSCIDESQWYIADQIVLRLSYCFSCPLFECRKKRGAVEFCFQNLSVLIGHNYLIKWERMK